MAGIVITLESSSQKGHLPTLVIAKGCYSPRLLVRVLVVSAALAAVVRMTPTLRPNVTACLARPETDIRSTAPQSLRASELDA